MNETQDARDVAEYALATMLAATLAAAGTMFVKWAGKKWFGVSDENDQNIFINNYIGEPGPDEDCDCPACVANRQDQPSS